MEPRRLLAMLSLAWTLVWVQRAMLSPAGPLLQVELGASYGGLGLLSTAGVLGGAAGYFAAGRLSTARPRACLVGGAALLALATLASALARDLAQLAAAQALAGAGEGLFYVPALALVVGAHRERRGLALGALDAGISVGSFLALLAAAPLLVVFGWRAAFLAAGALGLVLLPLLARVPSVQAQPAARGAALHRSAWPVYGAVTLGLVVYFALLYLAPTFLVARGLGVEQAQLLAAAAVGAGIPCHIMGGHLADRFGPRRSSALFIALFSLGLAALAFAQGPAALGAALVATYAIGIVGFVGLIALLPRVLGAELAGPAFGVFWGLGYLGGAAGPYLVGGVADAAGFTPAILLCAGLALLAAVLATRAPS